MDHGQVIKVDLAAVAAKPTEADLRAWASEQRVFISSVMAGMKEVREAVAAAVEDLGARPVWFENFGGRDDDAEQAYLAEVASCDVYVGLLGQRYGRFLAPRRYSATHLEYLEAESRGLRLSVWVDRTAELEGRQQDFLEEVRGFVTTGSYKNADELASNVRERLLQIAGEDLAPWCKLGRAMFRARHITDDGQRVQVQATIKDTDVRHTLEHLRTGSWGQRTKTSFTWSGRCVAVRVDAVKVTATSTRTHLVDLDLAIESEQASAPSLTAGIFTVAYGKSYSSDDLAEIGLRASLFGEAIPQVIKWAVKASDPLVPLHPLTISEDAVASLALVLITEHLVGLGQAKHVDSVRVGRRIDGGRRVAVTWTGHDGAARTIDGQVRW